MTEQSQASTKQQPTRQQSQVDPPNKKPKRAREQQPENARKSNEAPSLCLTIAKFQEIERTLSNLKDIFQSQVAETKAFDTQQSITELLKEKKGIMKLLKDTVEWNLEEVQDFIGFGDK